MQLYAIAQIFDRLKSSY